MHILFVLSLGLAAVAAGPTRDTRIVGGTVTNIQSWPFAAVILYSRTGSNFVSNCGGTILNNRAILTAAHCLGDLNPTRYRSRVGSTYSNSGGVVFTTSSFVIHPNFRRYTMDSDVAVLRVNGNFAFNNNVSAGRIAGYNYNLGDNQVVWAIGWGSTFFGGPNSPQLRQVQIWTVNQEICRQRHAARYIITANMLCSGWLDVGGRDQCYGDSGSPLLHNNVVVGVCSFGHQCALPRYPGVNARVSRFTSWITNNA